MNLSDDLRNKVLDELNLAVSSRYWLRLERLGGRDGFSNDYEPVSPYIKITGDTMTFFIQQGGDYRMTVADEQRNPLFYIYPDPYISGEMAADGVYLTAQGLHNPTVTLSNA